MIIDSSDLTEKPENTKIVSNEKKNLKKTDHDKYITSPEFNKLTK